jgi:hypothetical protein
MRLTHPPRSNLPPLIARSWRHFACCKPSPNSITPGAACFGISVLYDTCQFCSTMHD